VGCNAEGKRNRFPEVRSILVQALWGRVVWLSYCAPAAKNIARCHRRLRLFNPGLDVLLPIEMRNGDAAAVW